MYDAASDEKTAFYEARVHDTTFVQSLNTEVKEFDFEDDFNSNSAGSTVAKCDESNYDGDIGFFLGKKESASPNEDDVVQNNGKTIVIDMNMEQCHESIDKAFSVGGDIDIDMIISVSRLRKRMTHYILTSRN